MEGREGGRTERGGREGEGFPSPLDSLTKSPTTYTFWISLYSSHQGSKDLAWLWLGGLICAASCSPANIYHLRATRVREVPGSLLPFNFCLLPKPAPSGLSQPATFPKGPKGFCSHSDTEAGVLQTSSCPGHHHLGAASSLPASLAHRWLGDLEQSTSIVQSCSADTFSISSTSWSFISQNRSEKWTQLPMEASGRVGPSLEGSRGTREKLRLLLVPTRRSCWGSGLEPESPDSRRTLVLSSFPSESSTPR